jgi:hypothetical protein
VTSRQSAERLAVGVALMVACVSKMKIPLPLAASVHWDLVRLAVSQQRTSFLSGARSHLLFLCFSGGFLCDRTCAYGYTGYYCDQRACNDIFPCLNNGTCVVTEIGTPNVTACECPKGTIGFFCEVICPYGYYGEDCFFRDDCSDLLPCLNGGTCKPLTGTNDNSTFCECPFGFGDHFCDVPCPYGFTGTQCDQRASCNEDLPCLNGGTCKAQQGSGNATVSSCECPPAFGGSLCQTVCPAGYTGQFCDIPVE